MKKTLPILLCFAGLFSLAFTSCVPVKTYQKVYLNDEEMALQPGTLEAYNSNMHSYREGASGANGGNVGGGCGCR